MVAPFTQDDFTPDAYGSTPEDKARVANQLVRLVESNFRPTLFPETVYNRLTLMYGHIAEYNRSGFYSVWMSSPARRAQWLLYVATGGAYGLMPLHRTDTWADVEHAFAQWVRETGHIEKQQTLADVEVEASEREELARLQENYAETA